MKHRPARLEVVALGMEAEKIGAPPAEVIIPPTAITEVRLIVWDIYEKYMSLVV